MNDVDDVDVDVYVYGAVYRAVDGTVYGAVGGAVDRPVYGAVNRAVYGAVVGGVYRPISKPFHNNIRTIINQITKAK